MATSSMATSRGRVVIVDPRLDDYQCLAEPARKHLIRLTLTSSGASSLRLAPSFADALWLVSPQLPDMNGLDLLEMLQSLQASLYAVVVDAAYDRERETRALALRAVQYVCKPVQLEWIEAWQGTPLAREGVSIPPREPDASHPEGTRRLIESAAGR